MEVDRMRIEHGEQRLAAAALLLAATAAVGACDRPGDDELVFAIEQAIATSPRGAALDGVVGGTWDRLCVFTFHTPVAVVDSVVGGSARTGSGDTLGTHALLVFLRGERVVERIEYPREKGDFAAPGESPWYCIPRGEAVFQMRQPIEGEIPWIGPVSR
jgi:hypothetical protein